jgi:hypothetical protein
MGYTHYWRKPQGLTEGGWAKFLPMVRKVLEDQKEYVEVAEISPVAVNFNGIGDEAYETFYLTTLPEKFAFCKTANKLYDTAVCACLIAAMECFQDDVTITSDGDWDHDWVAGRELFKRLFGHESFQAVDE